MNPNIPQKYRFLELEPGPKMLKVALAMVGIKEIPGPQHNAIIMQMAKKLGIEKIYTGDEMAWCGLAHGTVITEAGKPFHLKNYDILRALKYKEWGHEVPLSEAMLGDTLIFQRTGGGHVGLYVAETPSKGTLHVLGGNQSNQYGFTEIDRSRLVAVRRLYEVGMPANVRKIIMSSSGVVSTNEA